MYECSIFRRVVVRPLRFFSRSEFIHYGSKVGSKPNTREIGERIMKKKPLSDMSLSGILGLSMMPVHARKYAKRWDSYTLADEIQRLLRHNKIKSAITVCTKAKPTEAGVAYSLVARDLLERGNLELARSFYQDSKRRSVKLSEQFFAGFLDGLLVAAKRTSAPISDTVTDIVSDAEGIFRQGLPNVIVNTALLCYGHEFNMVRIYELQERLNKDGMPIELDEFGFSILFRILYNGVTNFQNEASDSVAFKERPEYQLLVRKILELDDKLKLLSEKQKRENGTFVSQVAMDSTLLNTRMAALSAISNDESTRRLKGILNKYFGVSGPFSDENITYQNGINFPCSIDQWRQVDSKNLLMAKVPPQALIQRLLEVYHKVYGNQGIFTLMEFTCYKLGGAPDGFTFKSAVSMLNERDDNTALLLGNLMFKKTDRLSHRSIPMALHEICYHCRHRGPYRTGLKLLLRLACEHNVAILLTTFEHLLKKIESMKDIQSHLDYLSIFYSQKEIWNATYNDPLMIKRQRKVLRTAVSLCNYVKDHSRWSKVEISPQQKRQYEDIENTAISLKVTEKPMRLQEEEKYAPKCRQPENAFNKTHSKGQSSSYYRR